MKIDGLDARSRRPSLPCHAWRKVAILAEKTANTIRGYDVAYKSRGSWYAYRRCKGAIVDEVPVAWDRDWVKGSPPTLTVWFKNAAEMRAKLSANSPFVVAVAKRKAGSASSDDINGLFDVAPMKGVADPNRPNLGNEAGVLCTVMGPCPNAEQG